MGTKDLREAAPKSRIRTRHTGWSLGSMESGSAPIPAARESEIAYLLADDVAAPHETAADPVDKPKPVTPAKRGEARPAPAH